MMIGPVKSAWLLMDLGMKTVTLCLRKGGVKKTLKTRTLTWDEAGIDI